MEPLTIENAQRSNLAVTLAKSAFDQSEEFSSVRRQSRLFFQKRRIQLAWS